MRRWCVTVVAVLNLASPVRADEEEAIKVLEKIGADIQRDETKPEKPVVSVNLIQSAVNDEV